MIKFILLLPLKIIGLLFIAIGAVLDNSNRRRIEQEKQLEKQRRKYERIARIESARIEKEKRERARIEKAAQADRRRAEKEKAAQAVKEQKAAERRKALQFKVEQAKTDIIHYQSQRRDLLKLYNELQKQYDAATAENRKETLYRKILAINNQMRAADRIIERLQYTIGTG